MGDILVVDDDAQLRQSFAKLLTVEGHIVRTTPTGERGIEALVPSLPEPVIMDVRLPGMDVLETFHAMHEIEPKLRVIVMTAYGNTETATPANKLGAFTYVLEPFDIPEMPSTIEKALEAGWCIRSRVEIDPAQESDPTEAIWGCSKAMQELYKAVGRVASTNAKMLIRGESGTGKE